jgi:hypothetical protein
MRKTADPPPPYWSRQRQHLAGYALLDGGMPLGGILCHNHSGTLLNYFAGGLVGEKL